MAAITWLAEVFPDKKDKEKWLGITQAFASLGALLVTSVSVWISKHGADLPQFGLPIGLGATDPGAWRYTLMTGILPAVCLVLSIPLLVVYPITRSRHADILERSGKH